MQKNNRRTGTAYERIAGTYLQEQGYEILEYNYRNRRGEIDLIAKDGNVLVFFEIKYRSSEAAGYPLEAVHIKKQEVIGNTALFYLVTHHLEETPCRFDVIGILDKNIEHIKNAFAYEGPFGF